MAEDRRLKPIVNLGCVHIKWAYNHCAEMGCPNYVNKCAFHGTTGTSTVKCNLERAISLSGLQNDTREAIVRAIGLDPALEDTILLIANLAFRDGEESITDML